MKKDIEERAWFKVAMILRGKKLPSHTVHFEENADTAVVDTPVLESLEGVHLALQTMALHLQKGIKRAKDTGVVTPNEHMNLTKITAFLLISLQDMIRICDIDPKELASVTGLAKIMAQFDNEYMEKLGIEMPITVNRSRR